MVVSRPEGLLQVTSLCVQANDGRGFERSTQVTHALCAESSPCPSEELHSLLTIVNNSTLVLNISIILMIRQ